MSLSASRRFLNNLGILVEVTSYLNHKDTTLLITHLRSRIRQAVIRGMPQCHPTKIRLRRRIENERREEEESIRRAEDERRKEEYRRQQNQMERWAAECQVRRVEDERRMQEDAIRKDEDRRRTQEDEEARREELLQQMEETRRLQAAEDERMQRRAEEHRGQMVDVEQERRNDVPRRDALEGAQRQAEDVSRYRHAEFAPRREEGQREREGALKDEPRMYGSEALEKLQQVAKLGVPALKDHLSRLWAAAGYHGADIERALKNVVRGTKLLNIKEYSRAWLHAAREERHNETRSVTRPIQLLGHWNSWANAALLGEEITAREFIACPCWTRVYAEYPEIPAVKAFMEYDLDAKPTSEVVARLMDSFPGLLLRYLDARKDEHRRQIPSLFGRTLDDIDLLELATSVFVPPSSVEYPYGNRDITSTGFQSSLTARAERTKSVLVGWNTLSVVEFTARSNVPIPPVPCVFDGWLSGVSRALVYLRFRHPMITTVEDMECVDERFCCELCLKVSREESVSTGRDRVMLAVFTWRSALSHAREQHYNCARPMEMFRLLSILVSPGDLTHLRKAVIAAETRERKKGCHWFCGHCPGRLSPKMMPMKSRQMLDHIKEDHPDIVSPTSPGDYFLDEHSRPRYETPATVKVRLDQLLPVVIDLSESDFETEADLNGVVDNIKRLKVQASGGSMK